MTYAAEVLADSPLAYWKLDETSGTTAADSSGNSLAGTYSGGYTLNQPPLGTGTGASVTFNGSGQVAAGTPSALAITGNLTLEAIAQVFSWPSSGGFAVIVSKGFDGTAQGYSLGIRNIGGTNYLEAGTYLAAGDINTAVQVVITWTLGTPHHIVSTFNGSAWKLYVDGSEVASLTTTQGPRSTSSQVLVAAFANSGTSARYWIGELDEVAIYGTALSGARITAHASAAGLLPLAPGTITAASVDANGAQISVTTSADAATPPTSGFTLLVDGATMAVSGVTGSGTAWKLDLGQRWIRPGQVVTLAFSGGGWNNYSTTTLTNNSTTLENQVTYVGRRFGLFLHFSIETFLDSETSPGTDSPNAFAPTTSIVTAIDQWVAVARSAGIRYVVLTSKHHSGFCLWPSATSAYNLSASSWWAGAGSPDIIRLFTQKCRAAGLGVGLYFSVWDKYFELTHSGYTFAQYIAWTQAQLTELFTGYGQIDVLWIDGYAWSGSTPGGWPPLNYTNFPFADLYDFVKAMQPDCQVLVNNHELNLSHSDIVVYETVTADGTPAASNLLPSEACETIRSDNNWFWKTSGDAAIGGSSIASRLALINGRRSGYLLNAPPDRTGKIPKAYADTLAYQLGTALESGGATNAKAVVERTLTLALKLSDGTTPAASLTGLKCAFYDQPAPNKRGGPVARFIGSTDGSGVLTTKVPTTLAASGVGWLDVNDSDGTTSQSPMKGFSGPAAVS